MKNLLKYSVVHPLLVLLLVTLLLISGFALLSLTQTGTGILVQLAERALPSLNLEGVRGTLVSQVEADSLVWEKDGIRVDARQAVFEPEIELSIPLRFVVKQLTAKRLVIDLPPSADEPYEPFTLPDLRLPVDAGLDNVALDELIINQGGTVIKIRDVMLGAYTQSDTLYLKNLDGSLVGKLETVLIQATGEMGLSQPQPLQLSVNINSDSDVLGAGQLALEANGELQNYQAELKGSWKYAEYPPYQIDARGAGNFEGMLLDQVNLKGDAGNVALQGKLQWSPHIEWDMQASAEGIKPEYFSPDLDGNVGLTMASAGNLAGDPSASLKVSQLEGKLRDFPLKATLDAELAGKDILLHDLDARVGDNQLSASGRADEQLSIDWKVDAPTLSQFHPDLKGQVSGKGMLSGKVDGSAFQLAIAELDGQVMDYPLHAEGSFSLKDQVVSAQNLQVDVGDNHLKLDGVANEAQGVDWSLDAAKLTQLYPDLSGQLKGSGNAKGLLGGSRLALRIDELEGKVKDYPVKAVGALRIEGEQLSADNLKVNVGENQISLNGQADEDSGIDWRIDAPELAVLYPELSGQLKGNGNVQGLLDGSRLALRIDELGGEVKGYPVNVTGALRVEDKLLSADSLKINVGENLLSLNGQADEDSGIDWRVDAPELAALYPELSGQLKGNGNAKGLLDGSRLALQIDELAGNVNNYPLAASGAVRLEGEQLSAQNLKINVGENLISLNGRADEVDGINWLLDAPELVAFHPELSGQLTGDGTIKGQFEDLRLAVAINQLQGEVKEYPVKASGTLRYEDELLSADKLQLSVGKNSFNLDGLVDEYAGIDWQLEAPELSTLSPQLAGQLAGKGNAKLRLDGSLLALTIDELAGEVSDYPVKAAGSVRLAGEQLSAEALRLNVGENLLSLDGEANEGDGIFWQLSAPQLAVFSPELTGQLSGNGHIKGLVDGSRLAIEIDALNGKVKDFPLEASGAIRLVDQQLLADDLKLNIGENRVSLNGQLNEDDGINWSVDAPELATFSPQLSGQLAGNGKLKGLLDGSRLAISINELEGQVKDYPVSASGGVRLESEQLFADKLQLNVGKNQVSLNGQFNEASGVDWQIDAPELSALSPELTGQLSGSGKAKGLLDGSRLAVEITELDGKVNDYPVTATGAVRIKDEQLFADNLQLNVGENLISLNGQANEDEGIDWRIDAPKLSAFSSQLKGSLKGNGKATGLLDGSRLALNIEQLQGEINGSPVQGSGGVRLEGDKLSADNLKVNVGENRISLNGQAAEGDGIDWQIDAPDLAALSPSLKGRLKGSGKASGLLDGSQLALQVDELDGEVNGSAVQGSGAMRLENGKLSADSLAFNMGQNKISLNGQADDGDGMTWQLDAPRLAYFSPALSGNLTGNGKAKGVLDGSNLELDIDQLGGEVNGFPVQASGGVTVEGQQISADNLQINVGENRFSLNGEASADEGVAWQLDAPELATFSPELEGRLKGNGKLKGKLDGSQLSVDISNLKGEVQGYPVQASGGVRLDGQQLSADNLKLNMGENRVTLNGQADNDQGIDWRINAPKLSAFSPELKGSLTGKGNAKGLLDGSRLAVNIDQLSGEVQGYPVKAAGGVRLKDGQLFTDQLKLNVGKNQVSLDGEAGSGEGIDWQLDAPELAAFAPQLTGRLKGKGNLNGKLDGSRLVVDIETLNGKVQGYPVAAAGTVRFEDKQLFANNLQLNTGKNRITLNGQIDEKKGIDWRLDAPELSTISPQLVGQLQGKGSAKVALDGSRMAVNITTLAGKVNGYPVAAAGAVRLQDEQLFADNLKLDMGKNQISLNGQLDEKQGIDWQINASQLAAFSPQLNGQLKGNGNIRGRLDGSRFAVSINELGGQVQGYPVYAVGALRLEGEQLSADNLKLTVAGNLISLNGQVNESSGINWRIDAPKLVAFHPELDGQLRGNGVVKGVLDGSRLSLRIDTLQGRLKGQPVQAVGEIRLVEQTLSAKGFRLIAGRNSILLNGDANEATGISWQLEAPALSELSPAINGHLQGNGNVKGRLDGSRLSVQIAKLGGRVNGFPVNAQGGLSFNNKVLAANDLNVSMGQNTIRMNGVVDEGRGVNWSLNAPQLVQIDPALQGSLKGNGNISGVLDGSKLNVRIDQLNGRVMGYPLTVAGGVQLRGQQLAANKLTVNVGANAIRFDGAMNAPTGIGWSLNAQKLVQLSPALDGQLKGRGNIKGTLDAALITLNIADLSGRVKGFPVNAVGTVHLRNKKYVVANNLRVNVGANALRLDGQLDEAKGINWQLDAKKLVQLNPALDGQLRGNGNIKGVLDGSRFTVRVNSLQGRVKQYPVNISGEVSANGKDLTARNVLLNSGQNTVRLNGSIGGSVGLNWQIDARNIAQIVPGVKASVRGNGTLSGQLDGPNLNLQIAQLSGQIDGRPLSAKGAASIQGKKINVSNLQVAAGNNSLALNGQVSEPMNLSWKVNARNLAQAGPGLAGVLQGEGTVSGSYKLPQVKGSLKGGNVRYQDLSVQAVDINITQNGANYNVQGVLRNVKQGENVITYAEVKGQGTVERHSGTLAAVHKDGKLNAAVSGGLVNGQWNGTVNTLALRETVAGDWQLTAPIRINASANAITVSNSCLANRQNARLCAQQTSWAKQSGLIAKGQLQQVPLAMARPFLPPNIQLPGRLNADYQFEQRNGQPSARINVQLPDNAVVVVSERGRKDTFRYTNARANLVLNNRNATIDAQLDVVGHGQMRTQGQVVLSPENGQHRLDLRTTVNMPSITWLQRFSPQVDALQGSVAGDVRVVGLLAKPQVTGALRLQNGSLYLPETGSRLTDINLAVQASRADQLAITGTLRAGSGQLTANGTLRLAQLPNWSADVRLQGTDLLLMNSHEIQAKVSPDLAIKAGPQSVVISGTVRVPETTVNLRELPTSASVRSDDIVIVGGGRPQPNKVVIAPDSGAPLYIQPNVTIVLGERVTFNGFGLGARLTGRLRILRNRQDILAEGVLSVVDGVYKAYGQNLKINRGRLLFNGPIDNPGLDVRATREVEDDITVGISVGGTVETPESSLFSDPIQTQTDTLSYLLTGQSLANSGGAESAILTQAVAGLGLSGGESLAQQLGGGLGLDDVGLNTKGGDYKQSELSLGKRLGPKLYVKYIVGLFDSLQKVAVTYQINKKLQLEATSGVQQSIDLIYKIDTDRGPFGN